MDGKHPEIPKVAKGNMQDMAELASGLSLNNISSTELKGKADIEVGQTWKASVKAGTEEKNPIDPTSFKTDGSVAGSFHGRFGGFAEPHSDGSVPSWSHYEKDNMTKPETASDDKVSAKPKGSIEGTSVKAAKKSQNTKTGEWRIPSYEQMKKQEPVTPSSLEAKTGSKTKSSAPEVKKKKLTKAEKEIEDRTHSDSMLGPVIPDTRTEEEKIQGDAWEKEFRDPGKSERSKDVEPPKTTEEVEYEKARAEWNRNRNYFNGEVKDGKLARGIEHQFQEKYEDFLRNQRVWKLANVPRRFLGMRPLLPNDLKKLEAASSVAREQYFGSAKRLKELKDKLPVKSVSSEERTNFKDKQGRTPFERYQAMLARKLVIGVGNERMAIQQKIAMESEANSVLKKFKPTQEFIKKHRYTILGLRALGYAAIGAGTAASGGLLASVAMGSLMGSRVLVGAGAGLAVGMGVYSAGGRKLNQLHGELENAQVDVQQNFFDKGFASAEAEIDYLTREIRETEASTKIASVGGAVIAGLVAGNLTGNVLDSLGPFPHSPTDGSHPKWEGATKTTPSTVASESGAGQSPSPHPHAPPGTNPPPWEGSTTDTPKFESVPPDIPADKVPSRPEFMGDMKVSEAMQPKVEEVLSNPPSDVPIPEPELADARLYSVVKGDNVWNIMEGKGPDANPVGGESEVLKGMSLSERQAALDKLIEYAEGHPEFSKEVGAVKSGGDIHRIYPGESINVSLLDDKLRELLDIDVKADNVSQMAPSMEMADGTPHEEVEPHEPVETEVPGPDVFPEHGPVSVQGKDGVFVVEGRTADVNQLTLKDASNLMKGVVVDDPNALALLEEMDTDKDSFMGIVGTVVDRVGKDGTMNLDSTIAEWMKNSVPLAEGEQVTPSAPAANDNVPVATPYGFDQPTPNPDTVVREASASGAEAVTGQSLKDYVRSVEQPKNGFLENLIGLGKPNVAGTFEQMANLSIEDIKKMLANGIVPEGVDEKGFDVWAKEVAGAAANDNSKTLVEYVSGLANSRVA